MDACILTTLNKHVDEMNATIQERSDGEERTYKSADFFGPDAAEEEGVYPVEVLNTLTPSGMAPHQLTLRVGAPVVFLRNLNRDQGMMNGTRGILLALRPWSVQVQLTTGPRSGESFVVPRINLTSSDSGDDHIRFIRRMPLRLAYCMTINKAQGQTFRPATSLPQGSYRLERGFAPSPHTVLLRCGFFPFGCKTWVAVLAAWQCGYPAPFSVMGSCTWPSAALGRPVPCVWRRQPPWTRTPWWTGCATWFGVSCCSDRGRPVCGTHNRTHCSSPCPVPAR
jgi:hypothetical protein